MKYRLLWKKIWRLFRKNRNQLIIELEDLAIEYKPLLEEYIEEAVKRFLKNMGLNA